MLTGYQTSCPYCHQIIDGFSLTLNNEDTQEEAQEEAQKNALENLRIHTSICRKKTIFLRKIKLEEIFDVQ